MFVHFNTLIMDRVNVIQFVQLDSIIFYKEIALNVTIHALIAQFLLGSAKLVMEIELIHQIVHVLKNISIIKHQIALLANTNAKHVLLQSDNA